MAITPSSRWISKDGGSDEDSVPFEKSKKACFQFSFCLVDIQRVPGYTATLGLRTVLPGTPYSVSDRFILKIKKKQSLLLGDDLFTGERSSIQSLSDSHLSYYGEKNSPDDRPPNRLTGFMSDQIVGEMEDEEVKPKKKLVGYQPNKKEELTPKKESSGWFYFRWFISF